MASDALVLNRAPTVRTGLLIRRPPSVCFRAVVDPAVTTKVWYTHSSGPMTAGAELVWEWEMHGVSSKVSVREVVENARVRFDWSGYNPERPTTVEFRFVPWTNDATYVQITETGFSGDGDTVAKCAMDSTQGFTFLLSALKALLEHDLVLTLTLDAHPPGLDL